MEVISFMIKGDIYKVPVKWVQRSEYLTTLVKRSKYNLILTSRQIDPFDFVLAIMIVAFGRYPSMFKSQIAPRKFRDYNSLCKFFGIKNTIEDVDNVYGDAFADFIRSYIDSPLTDSSYFERWHHYEPDLSEISDEED